MDRGTAIQEIAYRLGNRTDLNARILSVMDQVQADILEKDTFLPWFLLSEDKYITTTSGEERVPLPTGFLREYEGGTLWYYDSTADVPWTPLIKDEHQDLRSALGDTIDSPGAPAYYALTGSYFRLAPVPDAAYTLYIKAWIADTLPSALLNDTTSNLWLTNAPQRLITETLIVMGRQLRFSKREVDDIKADRDEVRNVLWRDTEARIHANRRYIMGT